MNTIQRLEQWGEAHHPRYLDIVRIALGVFLILKGVEFANNSSTLSALVGRQISFNSFLVLLLTHYIIFAHIVGGFLIAVGLLTRVACIAQIPILLGALFLVDWDVLGHFAGFLLTLLILALVVLFCVIGSGPWSLERAFEKDAQ
ncbi:MAG: DoxX family protein [Bacteroidota bacterium]|nr:DoxX family protein [Bacteroidota bacterium]